MSAEQTWEFMVGTFIITVLVFMEVLRFERSQPFRGEEFRLRVYVPKGER